MSTLDSSQQVFQERFSRGNVEPEAQRSSRLLKFRHSLRPISPHSTAGMDWPHQLSASFDLRGNPWRTLPFARSRIRAARLIFR